MGQFDPGMCGCILFLGTRAHDESDKTRSYGVYFKKGIQGGKMVLKVVKNTYTLNDNILVS